MILSPPEVVFRHARPSAGCSTCQSGRTPPTTPNSNLQQPAPAALQGSPAAVAPVTSYSLVPVTTYQTVPVTSYQAVPVTTLQPVAAGGAGLVSSAGLVAAPA
ncbi:MAG: hypothetical protein K2X87_33635, partial [Gemmataceae bacterium]|nr:hypothetical protein [Gemmataceae bacterium]